MGVVGQGEYYYTYYPKYMMISTIIIIHFVWGGGHHYGIIKLFIIPQNMITELLIRVSSHQLLFSMLGKVQVHAPMLGA